MLSRVFLTIDRWIRSQHPAEWFQYLTWRVLVKLQRRFWNGRSKPFIILIILSVHSFLYKPDALEPIREQLRHLCLLVSSSDSSLAPGSCKQNQIAVLIRLTVPQIQSRPFNSTKRRHQFLHRQLLTDQLFFMMYGRRCRLQKPYFHLLLTQSLGILWRPWILPLALRIIIYIFGIWGGWIVRWMYWRTMSPL